MSPVLFPKYHWDLGQSKPQASLEELKNHTDVCLGLWFSDGLDDLGGSFPILVFPILIT